MLGRTPDRHFPKLHEMTGEKRKVKRQSLDQMAGILRGYKAASAANRQIRGGME